MKKIAVSIRSSSSPLTRTRKMAMLASALIPTLWLGMDQPGHAAGVLIHDYQFSGNFTDSLGGPALVPLNGTGTLNATNYSFAAGQGLSLSSGLPSATNYSIIADFSFATTSGYRKIVDFKTQTADAGLYNLSTALNFYPVSTGPTGAFASNVTLSMALTRDSGTNQVTGYVNGVQQITFTDGTSLAVFTGANSEIRFFIDDTATGGSEASAGVVDRIRIFDGALTAAQLNPALAATYWKGGTDGKWTGNVNNWASDAAGTATNATPTSTDDVTFSATGAANRATTLEQNFTIHSLTINDTTPVVIGNGLGGPFTLTISGNAGTGITVNSGANLTISSKVTLGGSSDTVAVNGTGVAAISGVLGGSNGLTKTGDGTLTLAGPSAYTGGTMVNAGTLVIDSDGTTTSGTLGGGTTNVNGSSFSGLPTFGTLDFINVATADVATINNNGGNTVGGGGATAQGGTTIFSNTSSANGSTIINNGGTTGGGGGSNTAQGGTTIFSNSSSANGSTIINNGGTNDGGGGANTAQGGTTIFSDSSNANGSTITNNGGANGVGGGGGNAAEGGTTIFSNSSSANGSTIINNGGTNGGGGGTGNIAQGGTTIFRDQSDGGTARAITHGNGSLDISGLATGGMGIGSIEGDGSYFLGSKLLTVGGNHLNTIVSGTIQDGGISGGVGGKLTKVGTGTLSLTGANTYTGGTTLSAGTLAAGNVKAFGSGNLTMTGGTLRTTGGPLAVDIGAGNILFSGGTYQANVGGTTPGVTHDQLKTTGMANIYGGTLALVQRNGYRLAPGDKVVLASAAGGVAGGSANGTAFPGSKVTGLAAFGSGSPLLTPAVNLYTTSVVLELMQGSFAALGSTLGLTANQFAVAHALDSVAALIGNKTGVFKELNFLDTQPLSTLPGNLDKISPEELTAVFQLSKSLANVQTANIERRLDEIRALAGEIVPINSVNFSIGGSQRVGKQTAPAEDERWGLWFTGSGEFTHVGGTANAAGFDLESGGVTAGVDYRFTDHFAAGISIGYMNTTASLANGGKLDVDGGRVGAYATWFDRGFHVDASVSGGPNDYKTRRTTPNNTVATASPGGTEVNLLLATGYDWKFKGLTIGPTASFQYSNTQLDGFTETGSFAPLSVIRRNVDSARSALGIKATYDTKVGRATLRHEVRAAWQHEFGDTSSSLTSSFATLGGSPFTVAGPSTGRDSLLVGAGFSIQWNARFATYAFYDGELLRTNYRSNNVSVGCRWQF